MIYSGKDIGKREHGVGFILDKASAKSFLGFNPVNDRIITLRLEAHPMNVTIIQVYAPTSTATDDKIEEFYGVLQDTIDQQHKKDMLVIMGDWNAKIGKNCNSIVTGKYGLGERNERGDALEDFCQSNNLIIGNTLFQQPPRRLWTWKSPGDTVRNQIDYFLIKERWRSSLTCVKTRPGADCGSDHQLLVAHLKLKLKSKKAESPPVRFDVSNIQNDYRVNVSNRFERLLQIENELSPNELWEKMKDSVLTTAKETIPKKRKIKQPWISNTTLNIADKRQEAKKRGNITEWRKQHREVSKAIRQDQKVYIEKKCNEMEKAGNDSKTIFKILGEIIKKPSTRSDVINDKNGTTLTETDTIKERWAEYCNELYQLKDQAIVSTESQELHDVEPPPLLSEVCTAMNELKTGKSPGYDDIPAELWKATGDVGATLMWKLCVKIWTEVEWPKDWGRAVFIPIPKKGNIKECSNHRTISLICHASKILLKIINSRMKLKLESEIADEQAGFRAGRGTRDQIVNIRNIIEKCRGHSVPLYLCFIDYSKAFDCVSHQMLWSTMRKMGFPSHIVNLIGKLYADQESAVRTSRGDTEWFSIGRGVRQGCILSPQLFNIYAEDIMREALEHYKGGVNIGGHHITNLRYADDTTLVCNSKDELLELLGRVKRASEKRGLLLNTKKTKIMVIDDSLKTTDRTFLLDGEKFDELENFEFLGSYINTKGDCSQEIRRRLAIARNAVQSLAKIWKNKIPPSLKLRLLMQM